MGGAHGSTATGVVLAFVVDLATLLAHPPALHVDRAGNATSWGASGRLLAYLDRHLEAGHATLETGAGLSTILFALKGCHHTAIVPDAGQCERISAWCRANGVSTDRLRFIVDRSENVLPSIEPRSPLDLALIDGGHGFPIPFLDWHYIKRHLRPGGTVVVDDVQIWTGSVLLRFLQDEPGWTIDRLEHLEFFAAQRTGAAEDHEWDEQPFVLRRSHTANSTSLPHRTVGRLFGLYRAGGAGLAIVRRGDWQELRRRVSLYRGSRAPRVDGLGDRSPSP